MMSLARSPRQGELLSIRPTFQIVGNSNARNAYGQAAQDVVCAALRLDPIPIDGSKTVCFDAERAPIFYEIKSVKRGGKVVIYDWRMKKEREAGVPLYYVIFIHRINCAASTDDLWQQIADRPPLLLVVRAEVIHALAEQQRLNVMTVAGGSPRNGYSRNGYKDGYRNVPVAGLTKSICHREDRHFTLYGMNLRAEVAYL